MNTSKSIDLSGKTILVVEDDYVCFQLIKEILNETNVEIIHAENSAEAISQLKKKPHVYLIFMDIQLPDMSGLQASAAIRQLYPNIPIVIQTAYALESYMNKSKEIGCMEYLLKPLDPEKVLSIAAKYAHR
ncbi:MAG: response regulator [Bacteroidales bacterium]|nr:response regulator [Bacteroidales bacterium]